MSDTQRCEPPEELRGKRGPHFVLAPSGDLLPAHWNPYITNGWWGWPILTTAEEAAAQGWRYEGVATPPSTVAALVEALEGLLADTQHATHDCGDEDCPVRRARAALALYRGEVA